MPFTDSRPFRLGSGWMSRVGTRVIHIAVPGTYERLSQVRERFREARQAAAQQSGWDELFEPHEQGRFLVTKGANITQLGHSDNCLDLRESWNGPAPQSRRTQSNAMLSKSVFATHPDSWLTSHQFSRVAVQCSWVSSDRGVFFADKVVMLIRL